MSSPTSLFTDYELDFQSPYFTTQLITYIGNKRSLLPFLNRGIESVKKNLGKERVSILDGFSGSGAVSRLLKYHATELWVNDLEDYCEVLSKCYLANRSSVNKARIEETIEALNARKLSSRKKSGFIEKNYAPKDDNDIQPGERVFYTNSNAKILDTLKDLIFSEIAPAERPYYLAPLLVAASVHTNTSGVFKGFHKKDGLGWFGGQGENALTRIKKEISLKTPLLSEAECDVHVLKKDVNLLVRSMQKKQQLDIVYYDPPYNQHPYGSNYFMLNILANQAKEIPIQDGVSGIAENWNRSAYNKQAAGEAMNDLLKNTPAKYVLISYNDEGTIEAGEFRAILQKHGTFELLTQEYNTYRGSRNLSGRSIKVQEHLWVLKKK